MLVVRRFERSRDCQEPNYYFTVPIVIILGGQIHKLQYTFCEFNRKACFWGELRCTSYSHAYSLLFLFFYAGKGNTQNNFHIEAFYYMFVDTTQIFSKCKIITANFCEQRRFQRGQPLKFFASFLMQVEDP